VVTIISPKGDGCEKSQEIIDGIHIYRHSLPLEARGIAAYLIEYPVALFWEFLLSLKAAIHPGFDLIHACNPPDLIFLVALPFKLLGNKRFLFDHHDVNPELYESKFERRDLLWKLLLGLERLTFKCADICIATNESYRQIAVDRGKKSPEKVFVVRSAPDTENVRTLPIDPYWRRGRRHMVAYVGVIGQQEGLDLLLASVKHIVRDRTRDDIQFVIVGNGPEWRTIVQLCSQLEINDWVTFTGRVDNTTLFTILSTADVCVNPDRVTTMNNLSTMNKIMEYMAVAKPIVQFDAKEGRVSAGEASLYAKANDALDFADKILMLIDSPAERTRMGNAGKQRLEAELAWKHQKQNLLRAYDAAFRPRKAGAGWMQRVWNRLASDFY
jgi:glycosyltransferase involved in cell wall biosynthesis